ncbi:MAG: aspartate--tRNA(Asn) ligase [Candidatus Micrarchaeota archaeon]|nr:aspartate--tRNA(Asn) ligase [Candidatus Micrarchaeota archaeon]
MIKSVKPGQEVTLYGYVHEFRDLGKIKFIQLRDRTGTIQVTVKNQPDLELNREDVVKVKGKVQESNIAKAGIEVISEKVEVLSKVKKKLPVDPTGVVPSELDTRLKYRVLDLRKPEIRRIFEAKSHLAFAFRDYLYHRGFIEIHTSSIVAAATEGGAELFEVQYFEKKAYLAQSPQLYKQIAVVGGLEKVYLTTPIFRAEKHNTIYHLNEAISLDVEMAFIEDHHDVIKVLKDVFKHMINYTAEKMGMPENKINEIKTYTYTEAVDMLNKHGTKIEWGEDFSKEHEKALYEILKEDAYVITDFPADIRAFYTMRDPEDPRIGRSFDLFYRGLEVSSGAQRIHIPEVLEEELRKRGLDPLDFEFYIEAFRYGAPPHGGFGMGLERVTMKFMNLNNIREAMLFPRDRTRVTP